MKVPTLHACERAGLFTRAARVAFVLAVAASAAATCGAAPLPAAPDLQHLRVTLQDPDGKPLEGWIWEALAGGRSLGKGRTGGGGTLDLAGVPRDLTEIELTVQNSKLFRRWKFPVEKVQLHLLPAPAAAEEADRDRPLGTGVEAQRKTERVTTFSGYLEPTARDQTSVHRLGRFHFLPHEASVAPCEPGQEGDHPNPVRMPRREFVFLDVGSWIGDDGPRDFGLIWGRHVYLCRYHPEGGRSERGLRPGLDTDFLEGMEGRVEIVRWAAATWAPAGDFDWDRVYVILPDTHLMTGERASVWFLGPYQFKAEEDLRSFATQITSIAELEGKLRVVQLGDCYDLWVGREPRLFQKNDRREIELTEPKADAIATLAAWMREIRGGAGAETPNPGEQAFRTLEAKLGADSGMVYVYGNHDNYLILDEVCSAAGVTPRRRFFEPRGLFMEHGHRMEARFWGPFSVLPHNFDGDPSGYDATMGEYRRRLGTVQPRKSTGTKIREAVTGVVDMKKLADQWAAIRDQPQYWGEQAQVWLGRQAGGTLKPPHVFVIGHTHMPKLLYIAIDAWRY
jgi:hypothetical protein